jgi:Na+-driven multidrug efflux pump
MQPGEALEIARHINHVASSTFVMFGISMVLFGVTRATGAVIAPLVSLFVSLWVIRFPFAEALLPHWGPDAIWWSFPLSGTFSAAFALGYYRWGPWRRARMGPGAGSGPQASEPDREPATAH